MFYQFNHLGSPQYLKIESGENFSFPPHLHQCFEVIIVRRGEMEITVDENRYRLSAGEALLVFPNQIHSLSSQNSEHLLCIFSPRLVEAYTNRVSEKRPVQNQFTPALYLVEALAELSDQSTSVEKKGVLYSLCAQFDRTAVYTKRERDNEKIIHKIFSFVEEHFSEECSLTGLSAATGYDYSYLSRLFKKTVGISFNAYVNHYRLSHACNLMENTDYPIVRCAYESGFASLRSFNRNFHHYFHQTPKEYRAWLSR